jgi:hypothetical protein
VSAADQKEKTPNKITAALIETPLQQNMTNTTLKDLVLSAQAAANEAAAAPDTLGQQSVKLAKFSEAAFDRLDFPTWENSFNGQLEMLTTFAKQDSPATTAAKKPSAK